MLRIPNLDLLVHPACLAQNSTEPMIKSSWGGVGVEKLRNNLEEDSQTGSTRFEKSLTSPMLEAVLLLVDS